MDISNLAPELAALLGISPSTMLLLIFLITTAANVTARTIPQDATGALGVVRKIAAILGAYVPSKVAPGVSVVDVAKAALDTPPIPEKVEAEQNDPSSQRIG